MPSHSPFIMTTLTLSIIIHNHCSNTPPCQMAEEISWNDATQHLLCMDGHGAFLMNALSGFIFQCKCDDTNLALEIRPAATNAGFLLKHDAIIKLCSYLMRSTRYPEGNQRPLGLPQAGAERPLTSLGMSCGPYHLTTQFHFIPWCQIDKIPSIFTRAFGDA